MSLWFKSKIPLDKIQKVICHGHNPLSQNPLGQNSPRKIYILKNYFYGSYEGTKYLQTKSLALQRLILTYPCLDIVQNKFYPPKELIKIFIKRGLCPRILCPKGFLPQWQMSLANVPMAFVQWDFGPQSLFCIWYDFKSCWEIFRQIYKYRI